MASYGWTHVLSEEVANAGTVNVLAPGVGNPDCDTENMELAVNAIEVHLDAFTADEDVENNIVIVTNDTGAPWPAGASIYVYAPSKKLTGAAAGDLAATVADHEARITALEGAPAADEAVFDEEEEGEWVEDEGKKTKAKKKGRK